jgi:hypothetical protein
MNGHVPARSRGLRKALSVFLAVVSLASARASAQDAGQEPLRAGCPAEPVKFYSCAIEKARMFNPPRTPEGKPDFQGYWNAGRQAFDIEEHAESYAYNGGPTLIVDPPEGKVPYQPWAAAKKKLREANTLNPPSVDFLDPNARCFLRGVPRQMWMMDYHIVQPPGGTHVLTLHEQNHAYRIIPVDGRPRLGAGVKLWMGDPRGRWEGDTLVVETTNSNGQTWLDNVGNFHSSAALVTERLRLVDANTILWEARIEDPTVYTRPWTMTFPLRRNTQKNFELIEFACHEGNRSPGLQMSHAAETK